MDARHRQPGGFVLVVFFLVAVSAGSATAEETRVFRSVDAQGSTGRNVDVVVEFDLSQPAQGWAVVLCHDTADLEVADIALGEDAAQTEPDLFVSNAEANFVLAGVVIDQIGDERVIPAGNGIKANIVTYNLLAAGPKTTTVEFCDGVGIGTPGGPTVDNFVVQNGRSFGVGEGLVVQDGTVEILPLPSVMKARDVTGKEGSTVDVPIVFDLEDPVEGWIVVLCHDPQELDFVADFLGDELPHTPEFKAAETSANGVAIGVVLGMDPTVFLPPGGGQEVHKLAYQILRGGPDRRRISFCDGVVGDPLKDNAIVANGMTLRVGDRLTVEDGFVDVLPGLPEECPRAFRCRPDQFSKEVSLSWGGPVTAGLTGFELRRQGVTIATLPASALDFDDTPALPSANQDAVFTYELVALFEPADPEACAPRICTAVVSPGSVCFADDFDDYANDVELADPGGWTVEDVNGPLEPATWTLGNPGRRCNPPSLNGCPTEGKFVISDSRAAKCPTEVELCENVRGSGMSHDLISPEFGCPDQDALWLHFDCLVQFGRDGDAVFDVDVSTDGGDTWTNVFRRVSPGREEREGDPIFATLDNTSGYFGRLDVDLTELAAHEATMQIRFRHFEPTRDYWISVDNIVVDDLAPPQVSIRAAAPATTVVYVLGEETFESGIPEDWDVISREGNTGDKTWTTADPCQRSLRVGGGGAGPGIAHLASPFSLTDSQCEPAPKYNEWLITPALDCSNLNQVSLVFEDEVYWFNVPQMVLLSLDGGSTFTKTVFDYRCREGDCGMPGEEGEDPYFQLRGIPVPDAAHQPDVAFAFVYESPPDKGWWGVDGIIVGSVSVFKRGDANSDSGVDISDGVFTFNYLFTGGDRPHCIDAADSNDDGSVDISDGIYSLNWLFGGGPVIPPPGAEICGPDPTPDKDGIDLGCICYRDCISDEECASQ